MALGISGSTLRLSFMVTDGDQDEMAPSMVILLEIIFSGNET